MKKQTSTTEMAQTIDLLSGKIDAATPCGTTPHSPTATAQKKSEAGKMAPKKRK